MVLPKLFEHFINGQVVGFGELGLAYGSSGNTLRKRVAGLLSAGHLRPIRQGLYIVGDTSKVSPYVIASSISSDSYVALSSALCFHAGFDAFHGQVFHVIARKRFIPFSFEGINYAWREELCLPEPRIDDSVMTIRNKRFGVGAVRVSRAEVALLECLIRPVYCRGLDELLSVAAALPVVPDVNRLVELALPWKRSALFNRLGLVIEALGWGDRLHGRLWTDLQSMCSPKAAPWVVDDPVGLLERRPALGSLVLRHKIALQA